jgi:hypothetical protein
MIIDISTNDIEVLSKACELTIVSVGKCKVLSEQDREMTLKVIQELKLRLDGLLTL